MLVWRARIASGDCAGHRLELQHHHLEQQEQRAFEHRAHRQYRCLLRPLVAAMVCAGMSKVKSASAAALPPASAVSSSTVAPASRATCIKVSTVEVSPGPELTRKTSPGPSGGVFMSPTTDTGRPEMIEPHGKTLDLQGLAAAAIDDDLSARRPAFRRRRRCGFVDSRQHGAQLVAGRSRTDPCRHSS